MTTSDLTTVHATPLHVARAKERLVHACGVTRRGDSIIVSTEVEVFIHDAQVVIVGNPILLATWAPVAPLTAVLRCNHRLPQSFVCVLQGHHGVSLLMVVTIKRC